MPRLHKMTGAFAISILMLSPASAFDASEHLQAVSVLWGLARSPDSHATTESGSHLGFVELPGNSPPKLAVLVTPREGDPCVIDQISSFHGEESSGYLSHTVVDLKKVVKIEVNGGLNFALVTIMGDKLICDRTLGLPNSLAPLRADIECRGMEMWEMSKKDRPALMAALATIDKTCPLAGFQP